jgi:Zn-dependent protease with chaperone function
MIASFFNTWPGMYLAQTFLHSLVAALIVDTALIAWKIENPVVRQRFRLVVIILPLLAFPLFQLVSVDRGSALFRLDALFDINRWLFLEVWGALPLGALFLLVLAFTAVVFAVQELAPIVRHTADAGTDDLETSPPAQGSPVATALDRIPGPRPEVLLIDDDEYLLFSSTGKRPAVYLSRGLAQALDEDELRAALAHEFGHIRRSRRPFMVLVFLLRVVMFYNPVILMEFRRIIQEEEKICDDLAVAQTGDRTALAGALRKFYRGGSDAPAPAHAEAERLRDRIEEYSHGLLIESRIGRLEGEKAPEVRGSFVFAVVLATVCVVSFYLV